LDAAAIGAQMEKFKIIVYILNLSLFRVKMFSNIKTHVIINFYCAHEKINIIDRIK